MPDFSFKKLLTPTLKHTMATRLPLQVVTHIQLSKEINIIKALSIRSLEASNMNLLSLDQNLK
jgi:hypothetical protein